jgi:hypothetical protein
MPVIRPGKRLSVLRLLQSPSRLEQKKDRLILEPLKKS